MLDELKDAVKLRIKSIRSFVVPRVYRLPDCTFICWLGYEFYI